MMETIWEEISTAGGDGVVGRFARSEKAEKEEESARLPRDSPT